MSSQWSSTVHPEVPSLATGRPPKLVLLGDFGSGKTALFHRLARGVYFDSADADVRQPQDAQISASSAQSAIIRLPDNSKAHLYDTCSMERFNRSLTNSYYRGSACVILVADATNLQSVSNLEHWNLEAECYVCDAMKILVFCKSDSPQADAKLIGGEIESYQTRLRCFRSAVVSSKTGSGIDELLERIVETCRQHRSRNMRQSIASISGGNCCGDSRAIHLAAGQDDPSDSPFVPDFVKTCCSS